MNTKDILDRLVELLHEDKELHDAAVRFLNAQADAQEALARTRNKRLN